MAQRRHHHHLAVVIALGLMAAGLALLLSFAMRGLFADFEIATFDMRYRKALAATSGLTIEEIVIVDIDTRSLDKLGRFQTWPRRYHAEVIDVLSADSARAVFLDLLLVERDADPQQDRRLVNTVERAGNVYLAVVFSQADTLNFLYPMDADPIAAVRPDAGWEMAQPTLGLRPVERVDGPFPELLAACAGVGAVNWGVSGDNAARRLPMVHRFLGRVYPTVALRMAADLLTPNGPGPRLREGGGILFDGTIVPTDAAGRLWLNYEGPWKTFRNVSYYDVLHKRLPPGFFTGKIVMIGSSAPGLSDLTATPFQQGYPQVELHATMLHNLLTGRFLERAGATVSFTFVLGFALLGGVVTLLLRPLSALLALALASGGLWLAASAVFAEQRLWIEVVQPLGVGLQAFTVASVCRYWTEERDQVDTEPTVERPPWIEVQPHEIDCWTLADFAGAGPAMQAVLSRIRDLQQDESRTLIVGEVGTGKELVARAIHSGSRRAARAFVPVRCAGLPRDVESMAQRTEALSLLFGHTKGAFPGAEEDRLGLVQQAQGGTLFFDEVGLLPPPLQTHLRRVLMQGEVRRTGAPESERVDVRVMAASSEDLQRQVEVGGFSRELYEYLAVHQVSVPPLRDRREDIASLAQQIADSVSRELGLEPAPVSEEVLGSLQSCDFPGNVRQLRRILEQALRASGGPITPDHLSLQGGGKPST